MIIKINFIKNYILKIENKNYVNDINLIIFNHLKKHKKAFFFVKLLIFIIINIDIIVQTIPTIFINTDIEYLNDNFIKKEYNISKYRKKIKLGIYTYSLKGGGTERLTSLFINYLSQTKLFDIYLLTQKEKEENEFKIRENINRIIIKYGDIKIFINKIKRLKIEILIYQFPKGNEIEKLNNMKNIKIIFYENSCFLYWIYSSYSDFKSIYYAYRKSKYVISLIPFENDYLLKKWGINSILMNNFVTYDYNQVIPSDLSSKTIIMIGRVNDKMKRFELGVESMKFIIREIPESKMIIISNSFYNDYLVKLVNLLNLDNNVDFVEYTSTPEIYFKNVSLHIFPSISESFGLVLSEIKIFGIPTILVGLDYVSISKGGTVILYDDDSRSIAKEAIKILKDDKYRNKLGKEARKSMKKFNNELLVKKWVKLIISIYNDDNYFEDLKKNNSMTESEANIIIKTQIQLLKKRNPNYHKITIDNIKNLSLMLNIF
jgi:hypothetical protein